MDLGRPLFSFFFAFFRFAAQRAAFFLGGIFYQPVRLSSFVVLREMLGDGKTVFIHEE